MTRMLKSWRGMIAISAALGAGVLAAQAAVGGGLMPARRETPKLLDPFHPTIEPVSSAAARPPELATPHVFDSATTTTDQSLAGPGLTGSLDSSPVSPVLNEPVSTGPIISDPASPLDDPIRMPPVRDPYRPPTRSPFQP